MNTRAFNNTDEEILAERACLVGVIRPNVAEWIVEDQLEELAALADTAGAEVLYRVTQRRMKLHPATMIGPGKVKEIATHCRNNDIRLTIFDDDLSPAQVRNLESILPGKVLDRSGLILDIFASRAHTRESRVQVELAQLEYYYPRLTRQWGHLKGQQGGIGFRGPGETQLEVDRRAVQDRISRLKKELNKIVKQRATRRKGRKDTPTAALVGYTNVGKSTLLNALSGKNDAFVENRLFATLDPKTRRFETSPGHPVLISDTVGFIRKLPHHLVASFRSTLEEVNESDLILHIADLSHPQCSEQIEQTKKVLAELGASEKPSLLVFNKIDRVENQPYLARMKEKYPSALFISAHKGIRLWELIQRMEKALYFGTKEMELLIGPEHLYLLETPNSNLHIIAKIWEEGKVRVRLSGNPSDLKRIAEMLPNDSITSL